MGLLKSKYCFVRCVGAFQDQASKVLVPVQHLNRGVGDAGALKIQHLAILQTFNRCKFGISKHLVSDFSNATIFEFAVVVLPIHCSGHRQNCVPERFLIPRESCSWVPGKLPALDDHADVKQRSTDREQQQDDSRYDTKPNSTNTQD